MTSTINSSSDLRIQQLEEILKAYNIEVPIRPVTITPPGKPSTSPMVLKTVIDMQKYGTEFIVKGRFRQVSAPTFSEESLSRRRLYTNTGVSFHKWLVEEFGRSLRLVNKLYFKNSDGEWVKFKTHYNNNYHPGFFKV